MRCIWSDAVLVWTKKDPSDYQPMRCGAYGRVRCGAYGPMLFLFGQKRSVGLPTDAMRCIRSDASQRLKLQHHRIRIANTRIRRMRSVCNHHHRIRIANTHTYDVCDPLTVCNHHFKIKHPRIRIANKHTHTHTHTTYAIRL